MASDPRNERRGNRPLEIRADDMLKKRLHTGAHNIGSDLSKVTKQLWSYWLGDTDELPPRPPEEPRMTITTEYGTWTDVDEYSARVEDSVAGMLGEYAADYDFEGLVDAYRDEIDKALPGDIALRGNMFYGPYPRRSGFEDEIKEAVQAVDLAALAERFDKADAS